MELVQLRRMQLEGAEYEGGQRTSDETRAYTIEAEYLQNVGALRLYNYFGWGPCHTILL